MDMAPVADFFHHIAPEIIELVQKQIAAVAVVKHKGAVGDYATQVDVSTEDYIIAAIQKSFSGDEMLAEEGYADTAIVSGRMWLIDPICGTNNLAKGVRNFCTNIALAEHGVVIASCVVDHSQSSYIWSVGDGQVYVGSDLYVPPPADAGQKIDVDFGSVRSADKAIRLKHNDFLRKVVETTDLDVISLNTSLGFAYTAIGKIDGFVDIFNHPWDIAAASFLIQQAGGVLTGIDGSAWSLDTVGAIGARTPRLHRQLLDLFLRP